ncbi:Chromosome condensation protein [Microdochium nivale]|nr:Chromosome condensation protein [Microdochium nivale]
MATPLEPLTVAGHSGPGDEAEAGLGTPAPRPDDAQGSGSAARTTSAALTELYTISYLVFFAIFGTLARVSLQALTSYPGTPTIFGSLWPNFAGCLVMGFLAENRKLFLHEPGTANSSAAASPPRRRTQPPTPPSRPPRSTSAWPRACAGL